MNCLYFHPTLKEVSMAEAVFKAGIMRYNDGDNGKECVVQCALASVWEAARRYEHEKQAGAALKESGVKFLED